MLTAARAARLAMPVAGLMLAHQVAGKAVRDATFLNAWPVSYLPAVVTVTAFAVVATVPLYSRLLERFGPRTVVSIGFLGSAVWHLAEWRLAGTGRVAAVSVYLHLAGLSALLLSGFWSVMSERFDVQSAKAAYGRIAAAGTLGGLLGGLIVVRIAATTPASAFLLLALLHAGCGAGVILLGRSPSGFSSLARSAPRSGGVSALRSAPHMTTLALIVVLGTAGATVADYLFKLEVVQRVGTGAGLLQFFAAFYLVVQVITFLAQFAVNASVRRLGIGATMSTLPAGVCGLSAITMLYPATVMVIAMRGLEAVLRGSLFRSAYELVFVPMDPAEKRRVKTFLDVTCDRCGDAVGAGVVQLILVMGATYLVSHLLAAVMVITLLALWLGRRLDALYLRMVERRLTGHGADTPVLLQSETGWTVMDLSHVARRPPAPVLMPSPKALAPADDDARVRTIKELRSGDRDRVELALEDLADPGALEVSQVIHLLAWNDVVPAARTVLERTAAAHLGLLTDALLDPDTDFAIRRRIPRVLGTTPQGRAIAGLVAGLDDARFEVRYQCSRAIRRLIMRHPGLTVDGARMLEVAGRELSVPASIWHGYRLIDSDDHDDDSGTPDAPADHEQRNFEHLFSLLAAVLPAEPLDVALRGIRSDDAGLRGVAIEYLQGVLPPPIWSNLRRLVEAPPTASGGDVPGQSDPPPPATPR
jgi:hypothetical protein